MVLMRDREVEKWDILHFSTKMNTSKITRHDKTLKFKLTLRVINNNTNIL